MASTVSTVEPACDDPSPGISSARPLRDRRPCFHCGEPCPDGAPRSGDKAFCCQGCLVVHDLLTESGLGHFYELSSHPGVRVRPAQDGGKYSFLDNPAVLESLLDFTDGKVSRVTFNIPAIHCVACVWLLENLFHLRPGIGQSRVNFARREVSITFAPAGISLSQVAALLNSLGYAPRLTLSQLEKSPPRSAWKEQWLKVGVAGFAFGNIMLFSLPLYLGLDTISAPVFRHIFGDLSLLLALPVLLYSASDYWKSALLAVRTRVLTLDVPIALGLAALYAQSGWEILAGTGGGYLDSLSGLVFFLLCGRVFQQKTHDRILFDLDYKAFFPLSVLRRSQGRTERPSGEAEGRAGTQRTVPAEYTSVPISDLQVGDHLLLRNGELLPADATLLSGTASIDYSFVTGESEPIERVAGQHLYAGGKQTGESIEVRTVKPVSQSYLSSLWAHEAFTESRHDEAATLTNRYGRRFTWIILTIAIAAALFWAVSGQPSRGLKAFISVLIVACPCALALAAPFTLGTAQRLLSRRQIFLKDGHVLERLAVADTVVFDKTGTLTLPWGSKVQIVADPPLTDRERVLVTSLVFHSTHPLAVAIREALDGHGAGLEVRDFQEAAGRGLTGNVDGRRVCLGSEQWLAENGTKASSPCPFITKSGIRTSTLSAGGVHLSINGAYRGCFHLQHRARPAVADLLSALNPSFHTTLLSGDSERDRALFTPLFNAGLHFNQQPIQKLEFVRSLQDSGKTVLMVGDGLNDAGALRQSDIGVAVVEHAGSFSPSSDVIIPAVELGSLHALLRLARSSVNIVRLSFGISALYNAVGISIGAAGVLSPLICAVLMPLSSVSVVLFACGATRRAAAKAGLLK